MYKRQRSDSATKKVEAVKESVEQQKQILIRGFSEGVRHFAEDAKATLEEQIDMIAESKSAKSPKPRRENNPPLQSQTHNDTNWWGTILREIGGSLLDLVPVVGKGLGQLFRASIRTGESLLNNLSKSGLEINSYSETDGGESFDPYIIRVRTKEEAEKIGQTINNFCAPHIQSWWLDTQDKLVRDGTTIRENLAQKIQDDIQQISNELSEYLGEALHIELNVNPIQFPSFEFPGIDAEIQQQQEVYKRSRKEERTKSRCCDSDKVYSVNVEYDERVDFYEVDLRQTLSAIKQKIDEQVSRNKELLKRVIENQVSKDFRSAKNDINDYIKRSQAELDSSLIERKTREAEKAQICAMLESQKAKLIEHLSELASIRQSLNSWNPVQAVK